MLWGYSHEFWSLITYVILYGATAGGFGVLRPRFAAAIVDNDADKAQSLLVFGALTAVRGTAIVISGVVASGLLDESARVTDGFGVGKWSKIIFFVGVMMLVASFGVAGGLFKGVQKVEDSTKDTADNEIEMTGDLESNDRPRKENGLGMSMYEEPVSERVIRLLGKGDDKNVRNSIVT